MSSVNSDDIKITATPESNLACRFTVDRPIQAERTYYFGNKEQAESSPLARNIFSIDGVAGVLISHDRVTVSVDRAIDWRAVGGAVGGMIREHIASGRPAISEDLLASLPSEDELREKVQAILEREVNPQVASHGGFIALLDVKGNNLYLQMGGGCQGCGMANVTLKQGVEKLLRQAVPEIGEILDATDHAAGANPYYR